MNGDERKELFYINGEWDTHDILWAKFAGFAESLARKAQLRCTCSFGYKTPDANAICVRCIAGGGLEFQLSLRCGWATPFVSERKAYLDHVAYMYGDGAVRL